MRRIVSVAIAALGALALAGLTAQIAAAAQTHYHRETTGGRVHTWSNYADAGGKAGAVIAAHRQVRIICRVQGFAVADGNRWWYRIGSKPWNGRFYASADAFYNNGRRRGPLKGTPFVDTGVHRCKLSGVFTEISLRRLATWSDFTSASGAAGPKIVRGRRITVTCRVQGETVDGGRWWYRVGSKPWKGAYYAPAAGFANGVKRHAKRPPLVDRRVTRCATPPAKGYAETTGGVTHTWTDYADAGGTAGPVIASNTTVTVSCWVTGFRVADGNTYWYRIASSPWSSQYYASADAFYNNGQTSGSLIGTPFVDPAVPQCSGTSTSPPTGSGYPETTGGVTHTWSDYEDAGGTEGPTIDAYQTVDVTCWVTGFAVSDGNTYWYKIASSPWSGAYYASADAFYNNGQTSGSLIGTPFVDPAVPQC